MKSIIITEKPSVAQSFAKVLGVSGRGDGYIENDKWIITWCVGHLVQMDYPEVYNPDLKRWTAETLPFLPKEYKYSVIPTVKKQFGIVRKIYHRTDTERIYYAGDPAREGIYIQMLVRQEAGIRNGIDEKVVWIDSQTDEEIRRGIREAKPLSAYANLAASGYERAIEDYAVGINFSRALSIRYGNIINRASGSEKYAPAAVGRVMTCVLGMVTQREREFRTFVPVDFYKPVCLAGELPVKAAWKAKENSRRYPPTQLYNETGFKEQADAERFIQGLPKTARVTEASKTPEKKYAPPLYNLSELQADCSKKLKISPEETLAFAQALYEKKLLTYPRTSSRVLSSAVAAEIDKNVRGLAELPGWSQTCNQILSSGACKRIAGSTRYCDDSKVTDHYALIPTGLTSAFSQLSNEELDIYSMVVKRFLSIFLPPAEYAKYVVKFDADGEEFTAQAKLLVNKGWYAVTEVPKEDAGKEDLVNALGAFTTGMNVSVDYTVEKGQTRPPKRYTSGSLILAMENAGNLIEDEELRAQIKTSGIGTEATRSATLSKLVKNRYLSLEKKSQLVGVTPLGEALYESVRLTCPQLLSPKMTAGWERGLSGVADGKVPPDVYRSQMEKFVREGVAKILEGNVAEELSALVDPLAKAAGTPKKSSSYSGTGKKSSGSKGSSKSYPKGPGSAGKGCTVLKVPYDDKDEAKAAGARWDADKKTWYAPAGADMDKLSKWAV